MTGTEIRNLRQTFNLSQPQLAEVLGVSQGTVSRWERHADEIPPVDPGQARILRVLRDQTDNAEAVGSDIATALMLGGGLRALYVTLRRHFGGA